MAVRCPLASASAAWAMSPSNSMFTRRTVVGGPGSTLITTTGLPLAVSSRRSLTSGAK